MIGKQPGDCYGKQFEAFGMGSFQNVFQRVMEKNRTQQVWRKVPLCREVRPGGGMVEAQRLALPRWQVFLLPDRQCKEFHVLSVKGVCEYGNQIVLQQTARNARPGSSLSRRATSREKSAFCSDSFQKLRWLIRRVRRDRLAAFIPTASNNSRAALMPIWTIASRTERTGLRSE